MKIGVLVLMALILPMSSYALVITEIMHSPQQGNDANLEWIEVLNDEEKAIDLSQWKIDGSNFDDYTISPGEYLVIAKKLYGGNESFETVWGNKDGVWDENDGISAIDGSFSLSEVDTVNLSNGIGSVIVSYDASSFKNGATLILLNGSYTEGTLNGTPGYPEIALDELAFYYETENILPKIISVIVEDDYNESGIQINSPKSIRPIKVTVNASDDDVLDVYAEFENAKYKLDLINGNFITSINITPESVTSNLTIFVSDGYNETMQVLTVEIIKKKSYSLDRNRLKFVKSNISGISTASFAIKNTGDYDAEYSLSAENKGNIPEVLVNGQWQKLSAEVKLPVINSGEYFEVQLRVKSTATRKGFYYGKIKVRT